MPMDENLRAQIETYLSHLDGLMRRGRELRDALAADPSNPSSIAATRAWQEDCGVTINQLSGGSKAHWLARSFSEAFLLRSSDWPCGRRCGAGRDRAATARRSRSKRLPRSPEWTAAKARTLPHTRLHRRRRRRLAASSSFTTPSSGRCSSRPTSTVGARWRKGTTTLALRTSCGILEAIVTDALEHKGLSALAALRAPAAQLAEGKIAEGKIAEMRKR